MPVISKRFFQYFLITLCLVSFSMPVHANWFGNKDKAEEKTVDSKPSKEEILKMMSSHDAKNKKASATDKKHVNYQHEDGPLYTAEQIYDMQVDGFYIHMTEEEAKALVAENGYKYGWRTPHTADTYASSMSGGYNRFETDNRTLRMYRYNTMDGPTKVYNIMFTRSYDEEINMDVMVDKLVEKYGEPTTVKHSYRDRKLRYLLDGYLEGEDVCPETSNMSFTCMKAPYRRLPIVEITVTKKSVSINMKDVGTAIAETDKLKARTKKIKDAEAAKNTKDIDF